MEMNTEEFVRLERLVLYSGRAPCLKSIAIRPLVRFPEFLTFLIVKSALLTYLPKTFAEARTLGLCHSGDRN
jgi:hypothetical protein